jgi:hypothetical protein
MPCDLKRWYGTLAAHIPTTFHLDEEIVFSAQSLPVPPGQLHTDQMLIKKSIHRYCSSFRVDRLTFHAQKEIYRCFGLLILSVLFHPLPAQVTVHFVHPASDIRHFILDFDYHGSRDSRYPGYHTRPYQFQYAPSVMGRHPWSHEHPDPRDLPCFWLTNEDDLVVDEDQWEQRDIIKGLGTDEGTVRCADLLLNMSNPHSAETEYVLEGDAGFRGVGQLSAEVAFLLPGSFGWQSDLWTGNEG